MTAPDMSDDRSRPTVEDGTTCRRRKSDVPTRQPSPRPGAEGSRKKTTLNSHAVRPNGHERKKSSKRQKGPSIPRRTWALPLALMLAILALYATNPSSSNIIHHFIFLSYKLEDGDGGPPQYGKGPWDVAFVCFYTILLSFTREFIMYELLRPLARICGIRRPGGKQSRFMEQTYTAVYIALIGPLGVYCMSRTPVWYLNTRGMYESYPHKTHDAALKSYYLVQAAFWVQQAIVMVLGVEKRRRDFRELVAHHVVTITLIGLSYRFHFTYMGIAVYVTHDISDFFLAISKTLNYINSPLQGASFGLCIAVWTYLRHYVNLRILWSILTEFRTVGPYGLDWETQQYKGPLSNAVTFGLLASLQAINLFWLYCLLRSAYRLVFHGVAKDDRSEDEGSGMDVVGHERVGMVKGLAEKVEEMPLLNGSGVSVPVQERTKATYRCSSNLDVGQCLGQKASRIIDDGV